MSGPGPGGAGGAGATGGAAPEPERAAAWIGAANLLGRVTGMAREVVFTAVFGAGMVTDAFHAASRASQLLRELLVEGSLQNAFVPGFLQAQERRGAEDAWRLANAFLGLLLAVLGAVVIALWAGAPWFVRLIAAEFAESPSKLDLTVQLTRWLSPFIAGLSLAGLAGGMLNARGRFFLPAMGQNVMNLLVLAACLLSGLWARWSGLPPILLVAGATTISGFTQAAILLPSLRREGFSIRPTLAPILNGDPALLQMLRAFLPALVGISTVQLSLLIESQVAAGYGDGALTRLNLSFRLIQIPLMVVSGSVATATLSALSLQEARQDRGGATDTLSRAVRLNSFLVLPCAVTFALLAEPITALIFERGAFTAADTAGTAALLRMYGIASVGICFHRIAVPALYALGRSRLPAVGAVAALLLKLPVIWVLNALGLGVEALPLSHAITVGAESLLLLWGMKDRLRAPDLAAAHLRMAAAALVMGAVMWALRDLPVIFVCAAGGLVYLGAAWALGLPEVRQFLRRGGLPPFLDPESREILERLRGRSIRIDGAGEGIGAGEGTDGTGLLLQGGAIRLVAEGGKLRLEYADTIYRDPERFAAACSAPKLPATPLALIVRVGQGPPSLRGLEIGGRVIHAEGDAVREGACPGPRIPVRGEG